MRLFAHLCDALDSPVSSVKQAALERYFAAAQSGDAAWAVYLLNGDKLGQRVNLQLLRELACAQADVPDWLFDTCYQSVGDLAETIALILPAPMTITEVAVVVGAANVATMADAGLAFWIEERLLPLRGLPDAEAALRVSNDWRALDVPSRLLLLKLAGGGFRAGVSSLAVQHALAAQNGIDPSLIAQRLADQWWGKNLPTAARYLALIAMPTSGLNPASFEAGRPYPFASSQTLSVPDLVSEPQLGLIFEPVSGPEQLGPVTDWQAEWQYTGLRGQIVKRAGQVWLWSTGAALLNAQFPEILALAQSLPDGTALDGEILAWSTGQNMPASRLLLQQRMRRKSRGKISNEFEVTFMAFDLLEIGGVDLRAQSLQSRRQRLEQFLTGTAIGLSVVLPAHDWAALDAMRCNLRQTKENGINGVSGVMGLILKKKQMNYDSKSWWQWQAPALRINGVLVYAQPGQVSRAGAGNDYSFAVWSRAPIDLAEVEQVLDAIAQGLPPAGHDVLQLLTVAKVNADLNVSDVKQLERLVRQTTVAKFGPVRSLMPSLVCALAFDAIEASARHKSGVVLVGARLVSIRPELTLKDAARVDQLTALLSAPSKLLKGP